MLTHFPPPSLPASPMGTFRDDTGQVALCHMQISVYIRIFCCLQQLYRRIFGIGKRVIPRDRLLLRASGFAHLGPQDERANGAMMRKHSNGRVNGLLFLRTVRASITQLRVYVYRQHKYTYVGPGQYERRI